MASQPCWRCMSRLSLSPNTSAATARSTTTARSLHTSIPLSREGKSSTLKLNRKKRVKSYKIPAVGERKALRKRIVLSNSNALPVSSLKEWTPAEQEILGEVVALSDKSLDALRSLDSFKSNQAWNMFNRPSTLMRQETMDLTRAIDETGKDTLRRLVVGARGCGKSVMLLQAQAAALMKGWLVIHFPEGQEIVNATTAYAPVPDTDPTQYFQPDYTAALLGRIASANEGILQNLNMLLDHSATVATPLQPNMTLYRLAETGANEPEQAWPIFQALWAELTIPHDKLPKPAPPAAEPTEGAKGKAKQPAAPKDQTRPQIMLTLDGIAQVSRQSSYLAPNMHHIHGYDLTLVGQFMSYLSGAASLPNGGAVIAAETMSTRPATPSVDLAIKQSERHGSTRLLGSGSEEGAAKSTDEDLLYDTENPFQRHDERVLRALRSVPVLRLQGFTRDEARKVLEYYAQSGMMRARVTDALVNEKWASSGGGLIRELERSSVGLGYL